MKQNFIQYFIDFEIYENGKVTQWGNSFTESNSTNLNQLSKRIRDTIAKGFNVDPDAIRFRQFSRVL